MTTIYREAAPFINDRVAKAPVFTTLLHDDMSVSLHRLAYKTGDQAITSNSTLFTDANMQFAMGASETWYVSVNITMITTGNTPDVQFSFTVPTGGWMLINGWGLDSDGTTFKCATWYGATPAAQDFEVVNATNKNFTFRGLVWTGTTSGSFALQWAQFVSNASSTTMARGSNIQGFKVGSGYAVPTV